MITTVIQSVMQKNIGDKIEVCACCGKEIKHPVYTKYGTIGRDCYTSINSIIIRNIDIDDKKKRFQWHVQQKHFNFINSN